MQTNANSSSSVVRDGVGAKRGIGAALFGDYVELSQVQHDLFGGLPGMDQAKEPKSGDGRVARELFRWKDSYDRDEDQLVMVPMDKPGVGEDWDWDFLAMANLAWFAVMMECGDHEVFLKHVGHTVGAADPFRICDGPGWKLLAAPKWYIVLRPMVKGLKTHLELTVDGYWREFQAGASTEASGGTPRPPGQGGSKGGVCFALDLNDGEHRVSSKVLGFARMQVLQGLVREMAPARFAYMFTDLVFDPDEVFKKCVLLRDEPMRRDHFNYSIKRMLVLGDRPVCTVMSKFGAALTGKWKRADWRGISLRDFVRPSAAGWGKDASYSGRADLLEAAEMFGEFQRIFKGEAFARCMAPLRALWEAPEDPMADYHNVYIQFQLESMICSYFEDVGKHRGGTSSLFPDLTLCGQPDCADVLTRLVREVAAAAVTVGAGGWEKDPHVRFYGPDSYWHLVQRESGSAALGVSGQGGKVGSPPKPWVQQMPPCHKAGLCFWWLAGKLGMRNRKGEIYACAEAGAKHVPLAAVKQKVVLDLVMDEAFTGVCRDAGTRDKVLAAVQLNPKWFK